MHIIFSPSAFSGSGIIVTIFISDFMTPELSHFPAYGLSRFIT